MGSVRRRLFNFEGILCAKEAASLARGAIT